MKYKHLLGRWKVGDAEKAVAHARLQLDRLGKSGALLKKSPDFVELHVVLYDDENERL